MGADKMIQTNTLASQKSPSLKIVPIPTMILKNSWEETVKSRLQELIRLEHGWDGYRAVPVSFENAYFAFNMLEKICKSTTEAPQIVPGYSGDLQIEWHTLSGDLELHIERPYKVDAWYWNVNDSANSDGRGMLLKNDFSRVEEWLKAITEPALAVRSAAA
jgi:hypothetical protein